MKVDKALKATLGALALAVPLFATAAPVTAADWVRCHDEITMYIGQLVDGKCLSPFVSADITAGGSSGYGSGDDSSEIAEYGDEQTYDGRGVSQVSARAAVRH